MTAQQPKKRCCGWVCRGSFQASSVEQVSPTGGGNVTSCSSLKDCGAQGVSAPRLHWFGQEMTWRLNGPHRKHSPMPSRNWRGLGNGMALPFASSMWSVSLTPGGENIVRLYVNHMTTKYKLEETSREKQLTYRIFLFRRHFLSMPPPLWFLMGIKASNLKRNCSNNSWLRANHYYEHRSCFFIVQDFDSHWDLACLIAVVAARSSSKEQLIWKSVNSFSVKFAGTLYFISRIHTPTRTPTRTPTPTRTRTSTRTCARTYTRTFKKALD